jgi:hypothetical protein
MIQSALPLLNLQLNQNYECQVGRWVILDAHQNQLRLRHPQYEHDQSSSLCQMRALQHLLSFPRVEVLQNLVGSSGSQRQVFVLLIRPKPDLTRVALSIHHPAPNLTPHPSHLIP